MVFHAQRSLPDVQRYLPRQAAVSDTGLLLYDSSVAGSQMIWLDRAGKSLGLAGEAGDAAEARLSPDGKRAAIVRSDADTIGIWVRDWDRGVATRFTLTPGIHLFPVWSPNGESILYSGGSPINLFRNQADGAGSEVHLTQSPNVQRSSDWSRDGRFAIFSEEAADTKQDLWILPMAEPNARPKPWLRTPFNEDYGRFSPEPSPKWVAYQSDETGRYEIYIQSFPEPHGKVQISAAGGQFPIWGPGGRELYYLAPDNNNLMVVDLKPGADSMVASAPQVLFGLPALSGIAEGVPHDVDSTGQRFLVLAAPAGKAAPLHLIVNWTALLKLSERASTLRA
jgi:eukaryotic-like serine/threonine-protein kinase